MVDFYRNSVDEYTRDRIHQSYFLGMQKTSSRNVAWQPLGPVLKAKLLVGYICVLCAVVALQLHGDIDVREVQHSQKSGKRNGDCIQLSKQINNNSNNRGTFCTFIPFQRHF